MRRLALIATVVTLVVAMSPLASATVHGRNGRIAFRQYLNNAQTHGAIFTINPDGTGLRQVTHPGPRQNLLRTRLVAQWPMDRLPRWEERKFY